MPEPARNNRAAILGVGLITGVFGGLLGYFLPPRGPLLPALPPLSSSVTVERPTPDVVLAVRNLARLESVSFHMERVVDLSEKQSQLFGLLDTQDAILLVAVGDVSAGVDLGKLGPGDVEVSPDAGRARIVLPPPEVFRSALDGERTYVHTRKTGLLARRKETLETDARRAAERSIQSGALEAGILKRAEENARLVVTELVRSLGYESVEVSFKTPPSPPG
ncbi:MAG TPA: DUF4230 domain-containing protein [Polyangiaceae bacterium]